MGATNPAKTNTQYCHYDEAHKDYVYTDAWKKFLVQEMKKPSQYQKVIEASKKGSK